MRADGRRLGRIIGQLDDLEVLLRAYHQEEAHPDINLCLHKAHYNVLQATGYLYGATHELNREARAKANDD